FQGAGSRASARTRRIYTVTAKEGAAQCGPFSLGGYLTLGVAPIVPRIGQTDASNAMFQTIARRVAMTVISTSGTNDRTTRRQSRLRRLTLASECCDPFTQLRVSLAIGRHSIGLGPAAEYKLLHALVILGSERRDRRGQALIPMKRYRVAVLALASRSAFSRDHSAASSSARNATESAHVMPPPE